MSANVANSAVQETTGSNLSSSAPDSGIPLLRVENISKQFPGTLALDNVSLEVKASEVHVLFGENGAGKSTMIQIIAGVYHPTAGTIYLNGNEKVINSVHHARELGISAVFQEFSIVPHLTVEENLFLGSEIMKGPFLDKAKLHKQARETLDRLGFPLRPKQQTMCLSRAEQQMVEIAKAFRTKPSIMILDEPTASLTERETNRLFVLIETLKTEGIGIIYITHRMNEIQRIGNRITVLRDGKFIETLQVAETNQKHLVELMTGRVIEQVFPKITSDPGETLLDIRNVTIANGVLNKVSMHVRAGEVVGLAGLVGSGKSEIGRACFGIEKVAAGKINFCGETIFDDQRKINVLKPRAMLKRGLYYVPSDRRDEGLAMMLSVRENMSLSSLSLPKFSKGIFIRRKNEKKMIADVSEKLNLRPSNIERNVEHFSGGNQQKALIGKALARIERRIEHMTGGSQQKILIGKALVRDVTLFIFDEPTVGVDVGARILIYQAIRDLCESGAGVLLISSDLPEILNLAHRTYVMYRGEMQGELSADETTEQNVLNFFFEKEDA